MKSPDIDLIAVKIHLRVIYCLVSTTCSTSRCVAGALGAGKIAGVAGEEWGRVAGFEFGGGERGH